MLHGTDTMAYTASALSFMLHGLGKSVVLTGSQIPLGRVRNDAVDNLLGALLIAGHYELPEVGIYFADRLLRGNRARKVDAHVAYGNSGVVRHALHGIGHSSDAATPRSRNASATSLSAP